MYQLPDIDEDINLPKCQWKIVERKAIHKYSEKIVKKTFKDYLKLKNKGFEEETERCQNPVSGSEEI